MMTTPSSATTSRDADDGLPGGGQALLHQLRYDLLAQFRNPVAVFFTIALPLAFLVMFTALGGGAMDDNARRSVPATMVIGLLSGTLTNLTITLAYLREYGMLRQVMLTPQPRWAFLASRVCAAGVLSILSAVLLGAVGRLAYGVAPGTWWPALVASLCGIACGIASGSALGVALAGLVRNEIAATPIANAVALPLLVGSGAFFPLDSAPGWIRTAAEWLPAEPVVRVGIGAYGEGVRGADVVHLVVVTALWTAAAVAVAVRTFVWTPRSRR
jgi:ABC-2 type transport system permease protein